MMQSDKLYIYWVIVFKTNFYKVYIEEVIEKKAV